MMTDIEYVTAWRRNDPKQAADVKAFWAKHQLVHPTAAEQRVKDLCALAYAGGRVVGVTTVEPGDFPPFRARFAFYRCAVHPDFRRRYVATFLTRHTLTVMEAWALEHPEAGVQGIAAVFEAWELGPKAVHPHWPDFNINLDLAGFTQNGHQVRVAWFRHARIGETG